MSSTVYDRLRSLVGKDQPEISATDEVCRQMIRHWCEAMEDGNPLYTDEDYARSSRYASIVAPPPMIWSWVIPPLWPPAEMSPVYQQVFGACAQGGFDQVIDTDVELDFHRPLFPGDRVRAVTRVHAVTDEKRTQLGDGHFVTLESVYMNQLGGLVCTQRVTLFIYAPSAGPCST